ncbi:MAG: hypothetical protein ACXABY_22410 [Candidatus Thorarchaeota archaeon]|jgi:hypothetical protein
MAKKHYLTTQGARGVTAGDKIFEFERVFYAAGIHYAVYQATDKDEQALLDELVESKRIQEITSEKYESWIKKKRPLSQARYAQVVEGTKPTPPKSESPVEPVAQEKSEPTGTSIDEEAPSVEHTSEEAEATEPVVKPKKRKKKADKTED